LAIVRSLRKPQRINCQQSLVREAGYTLKSPHILLCRLPQSVDRDIHG
jgi:hypothetical protein